MLTDFCFEFTDEEFFKAQSEVGKKIIKNDDYQHLSAREEKLITDCLREYAVTLRWHLIQNYGFIPEEKAQSKVDAPVMVAPPPPPSRYESKPKAEAIAMCKANIEKIWGKHHAN